MWECMLEAERGLKFDAEVIQKYLEIYEVRAESRQMAYDASAIRCVFCTILERIEKRTQMSSICVVEFQYVNVLLL